MALCPCKPPLPFRFTVVLWVQEEEVWPLEQGDFEGLKRVNIVYFVPLTWSLNGMEFDIGGRRVDNGVTTSGKEVQEALVNFRRYTQAGSVSKVKDQSKIKRKASSYLSKENAKLQDIPKLLLHIKKP